MSSNYNFDENAIYDTEIRAIQDSDPVSATKILNPLVEIILNNTHAVKKQLEKTADSLKDGIANLESSMSDEYATKTEVEEVKKSVADGKQIIADAISEKGQAIEPTATFEGMADKIKDIETGIKTDDANAIASDILSGKTVYVKGNKVTGTIPLVAGKTITPGTTQQTAISEKSYANGNILVAGASTLTAANIKTNINVFGVTGTFTNDADAVAANLLSGKTAYVKGAKITGTIPSQGAKTVTPTASNQVAVAKGTYVSGDITVAGVQLLANVGGTKRNYTVQTGAITAGNFVNVEPGITSNAPNITVGGEISTIAATTHNAGSQTRGKLISSIVDSGKRFAAIMLTNHASGTNAYSSILRAHNASYLTGTTTTSTSRAYTGHAPGSFGYDTIGNSVSVAATIQSVYSYDSDDGYKDYFSVTFHATDGTTARVSVSSIDRASYSAGSASYGGNSGCDIVALTEYRYLVLGRGLYGANAGDSARLKTIRGVILTATTFPFTAVTQSNGITVVSNNTAGATNTENYRYIRAVKVSATQVFVVAKLYTKEAANWYHALLLNIGTSSITVAQQASAAFATYRVNDMVLYSTSKAVFFGTYTDQNYLRLNLFTFSSSAITITTSLNITGVTNISSLQGLMVAKDVLLVVAASDNGTIHAIYIKITDTSLTHIGSHVLFSGTANPVGVCKISDTQVLLTYYLSKGACFRRVLTIPTTSVVRPFTTRNNKYGIAVTGGAIGATISVAEPN